MPLGEPSLFQAELRLPKNLNGAGLVLMHFLLRVLWLR